MFTLSLSQAIRYSHKLSFRSDPCTFLAYANNQKGHKCLSSNGKIFISRNVVFDENVLPFVDKGIKTTQKIYNARTIIPYISVLSNCDTRQNDEGIWKDAGTQHIVSRCRLGHNSTEPPDPFNHSTQSNPNPVRDSEYDESLSSCSQQHCDTINNQGMIHGTISTYRARLVVKGYTQ